MAQEVIDNLLSTFSLVGFCDQFGIAIFLDFSKSFESSKPFNISEVRPSFLFWRGFTSVLPLKVLGSFNGTISQPQLLTEPSFRADCSCPTVHWSSLSAFPYSYSTVCKADRMKCKHVVLTDE